MRTLSLENFNYKINRKILLVEGYSEIRHLANIIKYSRLKPYDYFFTKINNTSTVLYKRWFDEFGNSLFIDDKQKHKIIFNDLSLDRDRIISTDLYYGLSLSKIAKISKAVHIFIGIDEDLNQDAILINFLGIDNFFRTYLYMYGKWQIVSPLICGIKNLRTFMINKKIEEFKEFKIKEKNKLPCAFEQSWITSMPVSESFASLLKIKGKGLVDFLIKETDNK